jgi:hypothetical protein
MELKAGYTQKELNEFFKASFREKKTPRRTDDGGWTAVGAKNVSPVQDVSPEKGFWEKIKNRLTRVKN